MTTHKLQVSDDQEGFRLDIFLTQHLPEKHSRTFIKKLIDHGHVLISGQSAKPKHKVVSGELNKQVRNLMKAGLIEYTIPKRPNSPKQAMIIARIEK